MAADPFFFFFFASVEARSMSFPCCNGQSFFCRFRLPPLSLHTLRLPPAKSNFGHRSVVSKCSNSNLDSASGDFDILSTTECSDGSVIFRFGNASEMAKLKAQSQTTNESANVVAKVGGKNLDKEDISSTNAVGGKELDEEDSIKAVGVSDGEPENKKVGDNLQIKSPPKRKIRRNTTRAIEVVKEKTASVASNDREVEEKSVDSSKHINPKERSDELENVVKVENSSAPKGNGESISKTEGSSNLSMVLKQDLVPHVEKASTPLAASSVSSSKVEVPHGVKFQEENNGASEGSGENVGKIKDTALNMVSKMDLIPNVERVSSPLAASAFESEIRTELTSLEPGSKSEVPHIVKLEKENSVAEENDENLGKIEGATLNTESKMDLAVDEVCTQVAASENSVESDVTVQSTSLGACSNNEVPPSLKFQENGKDDAGEEVAQKSVPSNEYSINASKMLVMIQDANAEDVGETKLNSTLSEVESILNAATVHATVDEYVSGDTVKSSKMSDEDAPFPFSKEEIIEADAQSGNKVRETMVKGVELQSGGTTLEREEISTAGFFLYSGAALLPNPTKAFAGGEDAYFIACQSWLGVADGVGQWSLEGISVGLHAKELMENCEKIVSDKNGVPITDPVEVLNRAAANSQSCGSSTVLVAYFDDRVLHVANIGDSGFMIIRNGSVFKRSSPMVYEFNFPVLIERGDHPSDLAEVYRIDLNESDVIITATDGLFNNLYDQDIASIVFKSLQESLRPQEIAELLATRAQEVGQLSSVRSPFADEAQAAGYVGYRGGTLDDVTVIVSLVNRRFNISVQCCSSLSCGPLA